MKARKQNGRGPDCVPAFNQAIVDALRAQQAALKKKKKKEPARSGHGGREWLSCSSMHAARREASSITDRPLWQRTGNADAEHSAYRECRTERLEPRC